MRFRHLFYRAGAACILCLIALVFYLRESPSRYELSLDVVSSSPGLIQVFYDMGSGFNERDSVRLPLRASKQPITYRFEIPSGRYLSLRIDPNVGPGTYELSNLRVEDRGRTILPLDVTEAKAANQLVLVERTPSAIRFEAPEGSNDPIAVLQTSFDLSSPVRKISALLYLLPFLGALAILWRTDWGTALPPLEKRARAAARWLAGRPRRALFLTSALAVVLSVYPVVFFGKSFVSPNYGTALLFSGAPFVYQGPADEVVEHARNSDTGASAWFFRPYSAVQSSSLLEFGEFPFWNRYSSSGLPLLGQGLSMIGDPLHWITILGRASAASWDLKYVLARLIWAFSVGLLVYSCTRRLPGAIFASANAPFLGFFLFRINHPAYFAFCYAAAVALCWREFLAAKRFRAVLAWYALLLLCSSAMLNSGAVKEGYLSFAAFSALGVLLAVAGRQTAWTMLLGRAAVAAVAIVAWNAPWWASFLDNLITSATLSEGYRISQIPLDLAGSMLDDSITTLLNPALRWPSANVLVGIFFLYGLLFLARGSLKRSFWATMAVIAPVAVAVFSMAPDVLGTLPILNRIGHLDTTVGQIFVGLSLVLSGLAFQDFYDRRDSGAVFLRMAVSLLALALPIVVVLLQIKPKAAIDAAPFILISLSLVGAFCFMLLILAGNRLRYPSIAYATFGAVFFLIAVGRNGMNLYLQPSLDYYILNPGNRVALDVKPPALSPATLGAVPYRVVGIGNALFPGYHAALSLEGIGGPDPLMNRRYSELLHTLGFSFDWGWRFMLKLQDLDRLRGALSFLNVGWIVSEQPLPNREWLDERPDDLFNLAHHRQAWPRAFFIRCAVPYGQVRDLAAMILEQQSPFLAFDSEVPDASRCSGDPGKVLAADKYELTPNSTAFEVTSDGPGFIVLLENFSDYAQASLDGAREPILRANHVFQALRVGAPGRHRVEVRYAWRWAGIAFWTSLAGALGGLVLLFFVCGGRKSSRRQPSSGPAA
ncbi:MAG TPA: hypothetical protein VF601_24200 [Beijerinckiaceae bacterium]|jgi:hypothetical protein